MSSLLSFKHSSCTCILEKVLPKELSQIFEFIPFGVAMFDHDKHLIYHNNTLRSILGANYMDDIFAIIMSLSKEERVRKLSSTYSVPDLSIIYDINSMLNVLNIEDNEKNCEFSIENKSIWVRGKFIYINEQARYIITFADVTSQKECEVLKDINKMKSKIISSLSHEIRNPLHNILESLSNCKKNPKEIQQSIKIANSNANIILYKINDLLDYLQSEIDDINLDKCSFDLNKEVQNIINLISMQSALRKQTLLLELNDDIPSAIRSDPNRIKQVLYNLISNAINNTQENGIIQVHVWISKKDHNYIQVDITDNGPGIASEKIPYLFTLKENDKGSRRIAFGLPISYKICDKLGMGLKVESQIENGSKFSFTIQINDLSSQNEIKIKSNNLQAFSDNIANQHSQSLKYISKNNKAFSKEIKNSQIRARSLIHKCKRHATPLSSVEPEVTSFKTSKKPSYIHIISREINQQLKIRSSSDTNGKNEKTKTKESIRRRMQLQRKSGITGEINKILRNDKRFIISDAILNKCSTSQISSFFHIKTSSLFKVSKKNAPKLILESSSGNFSFNDVMDVGDEGMKSIYIPRCEEPKMLPKVYPRSIEREHSDFKTEKPEYFDLEMLMRNMAKKIKVCLICDCPPILIVDDNDFIRYSLNMQLNKLGLKADQATNGKVAVDKTFTRGKCVCKGYKLLFMDFDMPVMDGVTAAKKLRAGIKQNELWKDLVIVGVSAFSSTQEIQKCLNAGMKDFSIFITSSEAIHS